MGVDEARHDGTAADVDELSVGRSGCADFGFDSDGHELAAAHQDCFCDGVAGIDRTHVGVQDDDISSLRHASLLHQRMIGTGFSG